MFPEGRLSGALWCVSGVWCFGVESVFASAMVFGVLLKEKVADLAFNGKIFESVLAMRTFMAVWCVVKKKAICPHSWAV